MLFLLIIPSSVVVLFMTILIWKKVKEIKAKVKGNETNVKRIFEAKCPSV